MTLEILISVPEAFSFNKEQRLAGVRLDWVGLDISMFALWWFGSGQKKSHGLRNSEIVFYYTVGHWVGSSFRGLGLNRYGIAFKKWTHGPCLLAEYGNMTPIPLPRPPKYSHRFFLRQQK